VDYEHSGAYGWTGASVYHSFYIRNEQWLRAAQVIRSIVAVLTIPLTSVACSQAAVIWIQQQGQKRLSLRKTLTLADRGWADPMIFLKLMTGGFRQYATKFLIAAMVLNLIGKSPLIDDLNTQNTNPFRQHHRSSPNFLFDLRDNQNADVSWHDFGLGRFYRP
jgi:hypothetical protein